MQKLAKKLRVSICIGANEVIRKGKGNGTIYNTAIIINEKGNLANHHRKLMPTYNEKLIYGLGDGHGLQSVPTSAGNIGALICWEHWMPLARQAMHDEGEDIHIALWPAVKEMHQIASRQYAFEGRCFVVSVGQILRTRDIPDTLELPEYLQQSPLILNGGSCVISPKGDFLLKPQYDVQEILYLDLPAFDMLTEERMNLATSGHYQRHDVFTLEIDKKRKF